MNDSLRKGRKKSELEWWKNHIKQLISKDNIVTAADLPVDGSIIYKKDLWTLKKLIIYKYYIDIYTRVISKHKEIYYYFDLFSGNGLVEINNENLKPFRVFGSALLSVLYSNHPFAKYIYVDNDEKRINALNSLLSFIKAKYNNQLNYECINADMNEIDRYRKMLEESEHSLVVIDPEGLEPNWATIKEILSYKCDVIITFMSNGIARVLGKAKSNQADKNTLERFCGSPIKEIDNISDLENKYIEQIKQVGNKEAYKTVDISTKKFEYDIIIAAKKTKGNNPWLDAIDELKIRLEIDDNSLISIIRQLQGTQSNIETFF
ncbi:MAG: three-Cys-motif partner protein TcmP [Candidatus Nitrosocaldaceae archaeon]